MEDNNHMIAAAKRKARRLARSTAGLAYQQALDQVARDLDRRHWTAFLADPAPVPRDDAPVIDLATMLDYDPPILDEAFLRRERTAIFAVSATTVYVGSHGDHQLVEAHFSSQYPDKRVEFLEVEQEMIESYLGGIVDGRSGSYAPPNSCT